MDTSPAIPEAPAPETIRPRTTCHMVWPIALSFVISGCDDVLSIN